MTGRHLTTADVAEKLGVSVVAVYKMRSISNKLRRAGQEGPLLPEPVAIEGNSPLYDEAAIDAFAQERARRLVFGGALRAIWTRTRGVGAL